MGRSQNILWFVPLGQDRGGHKGRNTCGSLGYHKSQSVTAVLQPVGVKDPMSAY